ncbi:MAG: hypothetical protein KUG77_22645 [Nannocystaceae bacterium]|nr:hypothetical protein [Nannocystaceae bacterium]
MRRTVSIFLALGLSACFSPGALTDEMPEDLPAGVCGDTDTDACASSSGTADVGSTTGGGSSSTEAVVEGCEDTVACLGQNVCVADWDAQSESRGPFSCRFACVPLLDEVAWCSDDASCCDVGATCTPRGYCVFAGQDPEGGSVSGG